MNTGKETWRKIFYFVFVNVSKSDSTNSKTHTLYTSKEKKLRFNIGYYYTGQRKKRQILLNVCILYKKEKNIQETNFITASHWEIMYSWFIWKLKKYIMPGILQAQDCLRIPTVAVHISCAHEKTSFQTGLQSATTRFELFHCVCDIIPWFLLLPTPKISHLLFFKCKQERSVLYISLNVYALSFLNVKGIELQLWSSYMWVYAVER